VFVTGILAKSARATDFVVYAGTYSVRGSKGIYAFRFDSGSGRLTPLGPQAESENPSFLAVESKRRVLYAVNEIGDDRAASSGSVRAYRVHCTTGKLESLNVVSSQGAGPCYVSICQSGKYVFVANFRGGSIAGFPVLSDGKLGPSRFVIQHEVVVDLNETRAPRAHAVATSPDGGSLVATDLGLDTLFVYPFHVATGQVNETAVQTIHTSPGAGPRHFVFHPDGRHLYVVNERISTVDVFCFEEPSRSAHLLETISTLPDGAPVPNHAAAIERDTRGNFLYVSNRGKDSITVFRIERARLKVSGSFASGCRSPRMFTIDPTGRYLLVANEGSDNIVVFRIDETSGALEPRGSVQVPSPACLAFFVPNQ
jgi:6-phosphogluconolactonase